MRNFIIPAAALFGLATVAGCSTQDEIEQHQRKAAEDYQKAREDLHEGQQKARKDIDEARKEKAAAEQAMQKRQGVSGREALPPAARPVEDKLGDNWRYEVSGREVIAIRTQIKKPAADMSSKVADQIRSLRSDGKGVTATQDGPEVRLRGTLTDCDDAADAADRFAKIDGVNRIVLDVTCPK